MNILVSVFGFGIFLVLFFSGILLVADIDIDKNEVDKMGEMVCKEKNTNYSFVEFDRDENTIICEKVNKEPFDAGYIKIVDE